MSLPIRIQVTGTYTKTANSQTTEENETGYVTFTSEDRLQSPSLNAIAGPFFLKAVLVDGKIAVWLPSTTDPAWSPSNGTYLVKEYLSSGVRLRRITIPHDAPGATLDLADIADVIDRPEPDTYVMRSERGEIGGYVTIESDGLINPGLIPSGAGGGLPDASPTVKGLVQLTGDLGGTAASPTVPGLAGKASSVHTHAAPAWSEVTGKPVAFPPETHTHEGSGTAPAWTEITGKPASFPPDAHGHPVTDVTGLQTALDGKQAAGSYAAAVHGHIVAEVTGLQTALDGKQAAGSYAAAVHGHAKADVGLSNVDNTSDLGKPISTATQTALDGKVSTVRVFEVTPSGVVERTDLNYAVTDGSPDMWQLYVGGTLVSWGNENNFLRGTPRSNHKDDALVRAVKRDDMAGSEQGGYVELEDRSAPGTPRIVHARRYTDGALIRGNGTAAPVVMSDTLALAVGAPIPAGTPVNTVIVRF